MRGPGLRTCRNVLRGPEQIDGFECNSTTLTETHLTFHSLSRQWQCKLMNLDRCQTHFRQDCPWRCRRRRQRRHHPVQLWSRWCGHHSSHHHETCGHRPPPIPLWSRHRNNEACSRRLDHQYIHRRSPHHPRTVGLRLLIKETRQWMMRSPQARSRSTGQHPQHPRLWRKMPHSGNNHLHG